MTSFSCTDSPSQHVPSTPSCFQIHDWKSPEAEVPQIQQSEAENEDAASDYGVPRTPHLDLETSLSQYYSKSAQERHKVYKSLDLATKLQCALLQASPRSTNIASMSPFNGLMEQVVPGFEEDAVCQKPRAQRHKSCRSSKRQMLLKSRMKKLTDTDNVCSSTSQTGSWQSKHNSGEATKFELFDDGEIFA